MTLPKWNGDDPDSS